MTQKETITMLHQALMDARWQIVALASQDEVPDTVTHALTIMKARTKEANCDH